MVFADITYRQATGSGAVELLVEAGRVECRHVPSLSTPAANKLQRMGYRGGVCQLGQTLLQLPIAEAQQSTAVPDRVLAALCIETTTQPEAKAVSSQ